jgi:hypothetical protein
VALFEGTVLSAVALLSAAVLSDGASVVLATTVERNLTTGTADADQIVEAADAV